MTAGHHLGAPPTSPLDQETSHLSTPQTPDRPGRELPKEYRPLVDALLKQGWRYRAPGHRGHPLVFPPTGGRPVPLASTPSDYRSMKNTLALVRRSGGQV